MLGGPRITLLTITIFYVLEYCLPIVPRPRTAVGPHRHRPIPRIYSNDLSKQGATVAMMLVRDRDKYAETYFRQRAP